MPTDRINFDVNLPALSDPHDVAFRDLTVVWDRGNGLEAQPVIKANPTDATVSSFAPQDAKVQLLLVDVDNAGNRSQESVFDFVATDTVAPGTPGELGVVVTGEEVGGIPDVV